MALAPLFALALMAADPQAAAPATALPAVPAAAAVEALPKKAPRTVQEMADAEPLPPGAPSDDFGFVAWCRGALSGHMELFKVVQKDLNALPDPNPRATAAADAEMISAGSQYLTLYTQAMDAAEKANPQATAVRRVEAERTGRSIWSAAETAEPKTRMWSWVMWVLPGRCEYAAERLYEKSLLQGHALGLNMKTEPLKIPKPGPERDSLGYIIPK